jgi:metal-sulfur cluster biosynthetic enzyme
MVQESRGHVDIQDADTSNRLERVIENLKHVYDPEISVNIYDLGLIYNVKIFEDKCYVLMSLTSAFCPSADEIVMDVRHAVLTVDGIIDADVEITFTPEWGPDKMSEDAKLILGID